MASGTLWHRPGAPARRRVALMSLGCTLLLAGGCQSDQGEEEAPGACLGESAEYITALQAAPAQVRLDDDTAISDCLVPNQASGELQQVGRQMIAAATTLNAGARKDPTGPEAVQLGYLIGAAQRGQDSIHADLILRLNSAARFSPGGLLPPAFERTFGRGYAAGQESG